MANRCSLQGVCAGGFPPDPLCSFACGKEDLNAGTILIIPNTLIAVVNQNLFCCQTLFAGR